MNRTTNLQPDPSFPVVPRRDRIHLLRAFVLETFFPEDDDDEQGDGKKEKKNGGGCGYILDVAGGRGDFSFVLCNADEKRLSSLGDIVVVVVDPRWPDHDKIRRTCQWYHDHPDAAARQRRQQPLARLALRPPFGVPRHLRLFFESETVEMLQQERRRGDGDDWKAYWERTRRRLAKLDTAFPSHRQIKRKNGDPTTIITTDNFDSESTAQSCIVDSAEEAWDILQSASLVIGFHPDEATDAIVDFSLARRLPFCVVPCCVFAAQFPHRRRRGGDDGSGVVSTYDDYVAYLSEKHVNMRRATLPFASSARGHGAGLARNTVLYMRASDYETA